jgi:hypothetical protein
MSRRSIVISVAAVGVLAVFLGLLLQAGQIDSLAIGLIAISGMAFIALTHVLYKRMWHDDE